MRSRSLAFNRQPLGRTFFKEYPFVVIGSFYDLFKYDLFVLPIKVAD